MATSGSTHPAKIPDLGPVLRDQEASEDLLHSSTCLHLGVKWFVFIPKLYKSTHICSKKNKTKQDFKKNKKWFESHEGAHGREYTGRWTQVSWRRSFIKTEPKRGDANQKEP